MRTAEQRAADRALEEAIKGALEAHELSRGALGDYIVLTVETRFDNDGRQTTSIARLTSDDGVPHYRLLGLLDYASTMYRDEITTPDDEEA
jgi:hypothetical protein